MSSVCQLHTALLLALVAFASSSNCDYVSDRVRYVNVSDINATGPNATVFVGKGPLPENLRGVFWLVDDGGDALVSLGADPAGSSPGDECSTGQLDEHNCATVSTVRPGGWIFQGVATPAGMFGGAFPSPADKLYRDCGMKWQYCLDNATEPTKIDLKPSATRSCVNVFALSTTTASYKGKKNGGHYWRVITKALGIIPMPSWLPGNFDMIQVMDENGEWIQPAWDMFAATNAQIVYYEGK